MKKTLLSGFMLASFCASAQIFVNESFEGTSLPPGFGSFRNASNTNPASPNFSTAAGPACVGSRAVNRNLWGTGTSNSFWYLVYSSTNSNGTDLSYSFEYLAKPYDATSRIEGAIEVQYSVDGGASWTTSTPPISISEATGVSVSCTTVSGVIPGANIPTGSDFKIRIYSYNEPLGDYFMGIDNFTLQQVVSAVPSCTTVSSPSNGQVVNNLAPTIQYSRVADALSYKISVGTTPGGTDILNNVNNGQLLSYTIPASANLQYNTSYYVTVTPTNTLGDAAGCQSVQFNTGIPSCPVVASAITAVDSVTLTWSPVLGADGYRVSIGSTPGGTDILNNQDVGNVTTYQPSTNGMSSATTYYYTVNAYSGVYTSQSCTEASFLFNPAPPANDDCSNALLVNNFPYTYTQVDAVAATNNAGFISVCSSGMNDGVWYKFVGDGTSHTITVDGVQSSFDPKIQVYSGSCSSLSCIVSRDTSGSGGSESVLLQTTSGVEYYVNVGHYSSYTDSPEGVFTINITRQGLSTSEVGNKAKTLMVSPNPFVDNVNFYGLDVKSVSVIDASGRTVKTLEVSQNTVDLADLKSGLYVLLLQHKDGTTSTVKVIKK